MTPRPAPRPRRAGLGAGGTLPAVITGYFGNPWGESRWIAGALAQGRRAGRWPGEVI